MTSQRRTVSTRSGPRSGAMRTKMSTFSTLIPSAAAQKSPQKIKPAASKRRHDDDSRGGDGGLKKLSNHSINSIVVTISPVVICVDVIQRTESCWLPCFGSLKIQSISDCQNVHSAVVVGFFPSILNDTSQSKIQHVPTCLLYKTAQYNFCGRLHRLPVMAECHGQ